MDAQRYNLPAPSYPSRLGVPYHGLLRGGVLTLGNGRTITWPSAGVTPPASPSGDCYILRVPGTPPVEMPPAELAVETAAGREWRSYALLVGRGRNYGGINVGTKAWLYAAHDGSVWRIECAQLDTADLRPIAADSPPQPDRWFYPATLDFYFTIRRFGVFSPNDDSAEVFTRSCLAQSLGAAHKADPVYLKQEAYVFPRDRLYIGDGYGVQHMPINIEDVNSTGARTIFCVNRWIGQSVWADEDAAPRAWLEVVVSGVGETLAVSMSVLRVDGYTAPSITSSETTTAAVTIDFVNSQGIASESTDMATGAKTGSLEANLPAQSEVYPVNYAESIASGAGRLAGAYYDADDVVQWVRAAWLYQEVRAQGSGVSSYSLIYGSSYDGQYGNYTVTTRYWKIDYAWSMSGSRQTITRAGAVMGPHGYSVPDLVERHDVQEVGAEDGYFDYEEPSATRYRVSRSANGSITGAALGEWSYSDPLGVYNIQPMIGVMSARSNTAGVEVGTVSASIPTRHFWGAAALRDFENVRLRRVTNKVYAVVASAFDQGRWHVPYPQGTKVLAIGTPDGWTSGPAVASALYAAYNPGTRQFAHSASEVLGWV